MADFPSSVNEFLQTIKQYGLEYYGFYYGNYRGVVVTNADPEGLGRVQVRIPQISGDNRSKYWAWPKGNAAGEDFGDFFPPPAGATVWVEFENGNPSHPIYSGGHWGASAQRVPTSTGGNPQKRVRSSEKWEIEMDDDGDICRIRSKSGGHKIEITGEGNITLEGGGNVAISCVGFALNATGPSTMNLNGVGVTFGTNSISFDAGGGALTIDSGGVTIMGKDFLSHTHNGVDPGGGTSGGVT